MANNYIDTCEHINEFLDETKLILSGCNGDYAEAVCYISRRVKDNGSTLHTNKSTMDELGIDDELEAIAAALTTLNISHYNHSMVDVDRPNTPPFKVFIKEIKGREVYIKYKISLTNLITCISFHFPNFTLTWENPYSV